MTSAPLDFVGVVRFDHRQSGFGVSSPAPRLSWAPARGEVTGYELEVTADDVQVWTAHVAPDVYPSCGWIGPPLASRERRSVRVRAIGPDGQGPWSGVAVVEAGLLHRGDWTARVIEPDAASTQRPVFRRRFTLAELPATARLHATFHGIGVVHINGDRVGDDVLAPGWQSYAHRIATVVHDVTSLLREGENVIDIAVGDGWYTGRVGFFGQSSIYGESTGAIAQLELVDGDGSREIIATDSDWHWRGGPVLAADLYDGETHDARLEIGPDDDLSRPREWAAVVQRELPPAHLVPQDAPPVRATDVLAPVRILSSPSGRTLIDFGQNIAGWLRLTVRGPAGTEITVRHAEVLEQGELGVRPLRSAAATDRWILAGTGEETWEPSFTFHGFRYAEITGWPEAELDPADVRAVVVHSDLRRTGWFDTSHQGLRRLHENVVWSMRGNFVSLPTDCPQRDERLGWTGDIAVFAPTAAYLYDVTTFLDSWLRDLAADQHDDGVVPYFIPSLPFPTERQDQPFFRHLPTAVWGDAAVLVPFALYDATGDVEILRRAWPAMVAWVGAVERRAGASRVWDKDFQYGDWLDPTAPPDDPAAATTEPALVATAYFAQSARLAARAAELLGDSGESLRLRRLSDEVVYAFRARFVRSGLLTSDSQTAYAIALQLDLLPPDEREVAGRRLVELVRARGHRIATGFVGTPLILHALTAIGAVNDAYALALQRELPSWLYAVDLDATTIWERWDSMLPDGSINPGEMTSFNHYALGAVASWLHATVGGLSNLEAGWRRLRVAPRPHPLVTSASTAHETPSGRASVSWQLRDGMLHLDIVVPHGTTAELDVEGHERESLGPGRHVLSRAWSARQSATESRPSETDAA